MLLTEVWELKTGTGEKQCVAVPLRATRVTGCLRDHLAHIRCFKDQEEEVTSSRVASLVSGRKGQLKDTQGPGSQFYASHFQ